MSQLGFKYGVSPRLISERLLSREDKNDMLNGLVPLEALELAVDVWKHYGMCNYSDGSGKPYKAPAVCPMKNFIGRGWGKNATRNG